MLNLLPPQSMYQPLGIHFRNPFDERSRSEASYEYDHNLSSSSSGYNKSPFPFQRPLTPPPDMNTVAPNIQRSQHSYYGERSMAPVKYEPSQAKYEHGQTKYEHGQPKYEQEQHTYEQGNHTQSQVFSNAQPKPEKILPAISRPQSPVFTENPNTGAKVDGQLHSIAPSLQIPRSVNNSQGSLAELAAQITCFFWFETSTTLERAESSGLYNYPLHALVPDAVPTTGFRKWVTTTLSTTQVAQNVIILALLFIYRLKKLNPTVKGKPGSEYRLFTVALMLGNKFLDDNTYTNKTWAEVSGISVVEVHIMEVEFLSNMKYALFTSAEEWANWQTQLGCFANFFDQASRLPASQVSALGITLPSPPTSNHASPPYSGAQLSVHNVLPYSMNTPHGPTPNPSPLGIIPDLHSLTSRKRSMDSHSVEPPAKRLATMNTGYGQVGSSTTLPSYNQSQFLPRAPLPSLAIPQTQQSSHRSQLGQALQQPQQQQTQQQYVPQLPPLNYPPRSYQTTPNPTAAWLQTSTPASSSHYSQTPLLQSRRESPFTGSAGVSPINGVAQPAGLVNTAQRSPSWYLEQRNSPYRPIRGVSTLLVPPTSRATQQPQNVGREQMHYQPLGRPQERQTGQLPYIAQNQWFDGHHQSTASAYQWPSFMPSHPQQQQHHSYQPQLPLPTPSFGRI